MTRIARDKVIPHGLFLPNAQTLQVITALANDEPLVAKHRDHPLTGNCQDYRDCHVRPDLVLIYRLMDDGGTVDNPARLVLPRLGYHSELDL